MRTTHFQSNMATTTHQYIRGKHSIPHYPCKWKMAVYLMVMLYDTDDDDETASMLTNAKLYKSKSIVCVFTALECLLLRFWSRLDRKECLYKVARWIWALWWYFGRFVLRLQLFAAVYQYNTVIKLLRIHYKVMFGLWWLGANTTIDYCEAIWGFAFGRKNIRALLQIYFDQNKHV